MKNSLLIAGILLLLVQVCSAQQVRFVQVGATGAGSSWVDASGDLRAMLNLSQPGDEVWVTSGTYTPTTCSPCERADMELSFVLPSGVALRGGFSGTESSPQQRVGTAIPTILSGEIEPGVDTVGSYTVVYSPAPSTGTLLDRCTLTRGRAYDLSIGDSDKSASGALLYVAGQDTSTTYSLQVKDCAFSDGKAWGYGGAVAIEASFHRKSALTFEHCTFNDCSAIEAGGAVSISATFGGRDASLFNNCQFANNSSLEAGGGAIFIASAEGGYSTTHFENLSFRQNQSLGNGGAIYLYSKSGYAAPAFRGLVASNNTGDFGGAIYLDGSYAGTTDPHFYDAQLDSNTSVNAGGAFYGMAAFGGNVNYTFEKSTFSHNLSGESGGAILVNAIEGESRPYYRDCRFISNRATLYGGAIYNLGRLGICSPTLINCILARNNASSAGGMYCLGSANGKSNPLIINCAFIENNANVGGGLYSNGNDSTGTVEPFVVNTIFHGNTATNGPSLRTIHATPRLLNCSFEEQTCASLVSGFGGSPLCLSGNLFSTPNPFNNLDILDFSLNPASAVIDAGVDSSVLNRMIFEDNVLDARLRGAAVDLGPVEFNQHPILWVEQNLPDSIQSCEGATISLTPEFQPAYPASYAWVFNGDTISRDPNLGQFVPTSSGQYRLFARTFDEVLQTSVGVAVLPEFETMLSASASNADTICLDSTSIFTVDISSSGNSFQVNWTDSLGTFLSNSPQYVFTPEEIGETSFTVEVLYSGDCPDESLRAITLHTYVENCAASSTQDIDFQTLRITPNPAKSFVSLNGISGVLPTHYTIYDINGRRVIVGTKSDNHTIVNVSSLPQGIYVLIVESGQTFYQGTFTKL